MGRYEELDSGGLPGFKRGMMVENFQMAGMLDEDTERLRSCVR